MNKNDCIEIAQVANGYLVRPGGAWFTVDDNGRRWPMAASEYFVFRTMAEMNSWLCDHFTHRAEVERNDEVIQAAV